MLKRTISAMVTAAFLFTQCGLSYALRPTSEGRATGELARAIGVPAGATANSMGVLTSTITNPDRFKEAFGILKTTKTPHIMLTLGGPRGARESRLTFTLKPASIDKYLGLQPFGGIKVGNNRRQEVPYNEIVVITDDSATVKQDKKTFRIAYDDIASVNYVPAYAVGTPARAAGTAPGKTNAAAASASESSKPYGLGELEMWLAQAQGESFIPPELENEVIARGHFSASLNSPVPAVKLLSNALLYALRGFKLNYLFGLQPTLTLAEVQVEQVKLAPKAAAPAEAASAGKIPADIEVRHNIVNVVTNLVAAGSPYVSSDEIKARLEKTYKVSTWWEKNVLNRTVNRCLKVLTTSNNPKDRLLIIVEKYKYRPINAVGVAEIDRGGDGFNAVAGAAGAAGGKNLDEQIAAVKANLAIIEEDASRVADKQRNPAKSRFDESKVDSRRAGTLLTLESLEAQKAAKAAGATAQVNGAKKIKAEIASIDKQLAQLESSLTYLERRAVEPPQHYDDVSPNLPRPEKQEAEQALAQAKASIKKLTTRRSTLVGQLTAVGTAAIAQATGADIAQNIEYELKTQGIQLNDVSSFLIDYGKRQLRILSKDKSDVIIPESELSEDAALRSAFKKIDQGQEYTVVIEPGVLKNEACFAELGGLLNHLPQSKQDLPGGKGDYTSYREPGHETPVNLATIAWRENSWLGTNVCGVTIKAVAGAAGFISTSNPDRFYDALSSFVSAQNYQFAIVYANGRTVYAEIIWKHINGTGFEFEESAHHKRLSLLTKNLKNELKFVGTISEEHKYAENPEAYQAQESAQAQAGAVGITPAMVKELTSDQGYINAGSLAKQAGVTALVAGEYLERNLYRRMGDSLEFYASNVPITFDNVMGFIMSYADNGYRVIVGNETVPEGLPVQAATRGGILAAVTKLAGESPDGAVSYRLMPGSKTIMVEAPEALAAGEAPVHTGAASSAREVAARKILVLTDSPTFDLGVKRSQHPSSNVEVISVDLSKRLSGDGSLTDLGIIQEEIKHQNPDEVYVYFGNKANRDLLTGVTGVKFEDITDKGIVDALQFLSAV